MLTILGGMGVAHGEPLFESRPVHPLAINAEGTRLYAVNPAEGRLSIFALGGEEHPAPSLFAEVPVGLLPVTVRLRNEEEAWIVNELSDSITILSLPDHRTLATIATGDEPADVVFADGKAFVTCSRDHSVRVYDADSREELAILRLEGLLPRALAVSHGGDKVHVAFLHTSNGTTILPRTEAPAQEPPAYTDPTLPEPPQVAQIVSTEHPDIDYEVLDHDIATIDSDNLSISYTGGIGTNILALATTEDNTLLAANSEARNLIPFESELRGRFAISRLGILRADGFGDITLNPDPDGIFPNIDTTAADTALAQPMAVLPVTNEKAYLAAYGSDRIALIDLPTGTLDWRVDLRMNDDPEAPRGPLTVRGPRGLAVHPSQPRLYVFNKLSHTLSTIDTVAKEVIAEVGLATFPDLASDLKIGRALLQDARLSGNGSVSCASCHIDLERDGIAWNLGDPFGEMQTIPGALRSLHENDTYVNRTLHPLKGPMITQTLIGLSDQSKLHWRGDRARIQDFNPTFDKLMGGSEIPAAEMDKIADYLLALRHHPNPRLNPDRSFPAEIEGGDPLAGLLVFTKFENHCAACHSLPSGTSNNLDIPSTFGSFQPLKDAPLLTLEHRRHFDNRPGARNVTGFGLLSDGTGAGHEFPIVHPYSLHELDDVDRPASVRAKEKRDLTAFLLAFDNGTAPAVGQSATFTPGEGADPSKQARVELLQTLAGNEMTSTGLIARGHWQGERATFFYQPESGGYQAPDQEGEFTLADLLSGLTPGDSLTFLGVPVDSARRLSIDRDGNGLPDRGDAPALILNNQLLRWPTTRPGWTLHHSRDLRDWQPFTAPVHSDSEHYLAPADTPDDRQFFLLQRRW
ncbi:YncE family protein [Roseibacillus ishigakijimensis]|uniref:Cytochrome c domain-containing protein n=1 Tax=Roseibacillus ishigakijimensis TaxID=454146 RepID=A0A934RTX3_9BACT|nr:hypothetical protein [Roseibacillus ishigakijimensis]